MRITGMSKLETALMAASTLVAWNHCRRIPVEFSHIFKPVRKTRKAINGFLYHVRLDFECPGGKHNCQQVFQIVFSRQSIGFKTKVVCLFFIQTDDDLFIFYIGMPTFLFVNP